MSKELQIDIHISGSSVEDVQKACREIAGLVSKQIAADLGKAPAARSTAGAAQPPTAPAAKAPAPPADTSQNENNAGDGPGEDAPSAAPSSPAGDVELDANGVPWDERIHSGSHKKNKDGTWAKRRGVSAEKYEKLGKELAASTAPPAPPAPPAAATPPAAPPPPVPTGDAITFKQVMERFAALINTKQWTSTTLAVKLAEMGLTSMEQLADNDAKRAEFWKTMPEPKA